MSLNISQLWFGLLIIFMMCSTGIDGQLEGFLKMNVSDDTIDAALQNDRMMQKQANCLMNYGRCDAIGRKVKGISIYLLNLFITNQNIYFIKNLKKKLPFRTLLMGSARAVAKSSTNRSKESWRS